MVDVPDKSKASRQAQAEWKAKGLKRFKDLGIPDVPDIDWSALMREKYEEDSPPPTHSGGVTGVTDSSPPDEKQADE